MFKKLSEKDWKEIRSLLQSKDRNITKIAKDYGISRNSVYSYAKRRNWITTKSVQNPKKRNFLKKWLRKFIQ